MAKILIVDDEFGIAELFEALLVDEGHEVFTAANGKQGLEMLVMTKPDLVFLDYMMPVMDGASMLTAMMADEGATDIPVILMSSMPEAAVAARCRGYALFMRKPFYVSDILEIVQRFIPRHSA
jgi:CheY-like chemotaxis protein